MVEILDDFGGSVHKGMDSKTLYNWTPSDTFFINPIKERFIYQARGWKPEEMK